jgi:hypothetical protein
LKQVNVDLQSSDAGVSSKNKTNACILFDFLFLGAWWGCVRENLILMVQIW